MTTQQYCVMITKFVNWQIYSLLAKHAAWMGHYHPDIILVSQTYTVVNTNLDDGVSNKQD